MKTGRFNSISLLAFTPVLMVIGWRASAQDAAKVAPSMVKVLLENENVRVLEVLRQPGDILGAHSHPASMVYFLTACKIRSTAPGREPVVIEHKSGETAWRDPLTHLEENVGKTEARAMVVEMKMALKQSQPAGTQPSMTTAPTPIQMNKDNIINDLNNLSAQVYQFRIRPKNMGGGEGSHEGFVLPAGLMSNRKATFDVKVLGKDLVQFVATSAVGYGSVKATVNEFGVLANWEYTGGFKVSSPTPTVGVDDNRDAMINDFNNLAALCYQYRIRPTSMGGGGGSYDSFEIPARMR